MPNLQKKRQLIFEIFNIKKCTLFFFWNQVYYASTTLMSEIDTGVRNQRPLFMLKYLFPRGLKET